MKILLPALTLAICGCGNGGALGLAAARVRCGESRLAGTGVAMTDNEWDALVATHTQARDDGLSREDAVTFGNFTCVGNDLCIQCNEALVAALWP